MRIILTFLYIFQFSSLTFAIVRLEKVDVKILDPSKAKCTVEIIPGKPSTVVNLHAETFFEGEDITVKFAAFSFIDGHYNEFIETNSVSICDMPKSDHPLISFMYKELSKAGNLTTACPVKKGTYVLRDFKILESDLPISLPPGSFKLELNGSLHENNQLIPLFVSDIYFKEM
ncbi:CLUMA_CG021032, isoform A [Clunio marinus]|uniref:CLUMA_CG021032, isoform A n=1 Tax=Clunio marinus TaxID=568069 RepID=A0A1J1J8S9_9DIPT|nr:CLUMA_CG021032, isoform A [Clunio marinus]